MDEEHICSREDQCREAAGIEALRVGAAFQHNNKERVYKMGKYVDFDQFIAEREQETKTVRIFGRECTVPIEVPFDYMMKAIRLAEAQKGVSAEDNLQLLEQMFTKEDFEFIVRNPGFKLSHVHALVRLIWLRPDDEPSEESAEITEDELAIQNTKGKRPKKA